MKISILGGGKWGTALAILYAHKYPSVSFWIRPESRYNGRSLSDYIGKNRANPSKFPGVAIPENVAVSDNFSEVVNGSDIVISAIPSAYLKQYLMKLKKCSFRRFVNASKGVIGEKPISFCFREIVGDVPYAVISGPDIASEIVENFKGSRISTAFATVASARKDRLVEKLEFKPYFRLQFHKDVKSVEYCGILKQIYAMVLGICMGMGYGVNTAAGLFHASGREIKRILEYLGCDPKVYDETYAGYPDLEVTYKSGRHGRIGRLIAQHGVKAAKEQMKGECIEGFRILESMHRTTKNSGLRLPILNELYAIVYQGKKLSKSIDSLMNS